MFSLAILIGIYSYVIFAVGLLGVLYKPIVILLTTFYILTTLYYYRGKIKMNLLRCFETFKEIQKSPVNLIKRNLLLTILLSMLLSQGIVNLIGALGLELGFDALWYHLTLPKLYLGNHSIFYIPGGLLYYSAMPRLTEMLYVAALALNGEILAKVIHFSFGILTCIALYKLSREFFSAKISLLAVVIFYSNLVVGWQSITAYVDLARTFFEIMAFWGFVNFWKKGSKKWLVESAIMLGLAISTKLLALGSLIIFTVLLVYPLFFKNPPRRSHGFADAQPATVRGAAIIKLFVYWVICLLIPLPWFVFSYINTGNLVYPFFTEIYNIGFNIELLDPIRFVREVWSIFMESSDPISPIYIIFLPIVILTFFRRFRDSGQARMTILQLIALYSFLAIIVWYFTPRTGGGRFILPYLPAFSIVVARVVDRMGIYSSRDPSSDGELRSFKVLDFARTINFRLLCIGLIIFVSLISILYRGFANSRYVPVVLGKQTKADFLSSNLNFSFGDFYDTDGYFKKHIKLSDNVLLYGFHNLYYVDFPYIDSSWAKKGDSFDYIAVQNTNLPKRFRDWDIIYLNPKTQVKLYSKGGIKWAY